MNHPVSSVVQVVASSPEENSVVEDQRHAEQSLMSSSYTPSSTVIVAAPPSSKVQILSSHVEVITQEAKPSKMNTPVSPPPKKSIISKVNIKEEKSSIVKPTPVLSSHVEIRTNSPSIVISEPEKPAVLSSVVEILSSDSDVEPVLQVENNIGEPEYDFLSRQPSEFAEETYRVHNIKPSNAKPAQKSRQTAEPKKSNANKNDNIHPTGLVTKLGGTVVKDGATTVHETSVIGTYISGKYAQVLQSTSHIFQNNAKPKIAPTSTLRILKTAAPHVPKNKHVIEPTPTKSVDSNSLPIDEVYGSGPNLVRSSRRPATSSGSFKNRFRNRNSKDDVDYQEAVQEIQPTSAYNSPKKSRSNKPKK